MLITGHHNLPGTPPVIRVISPVMYEASSDARNETRPQTSDGSPILKIRQNRK